MMRILIDQQYHIGHYYHYIAHLLPALLEQRHEVVVAVTEEGLQSPEFANLLARFQPGVQFPPLLPPASPWLPLNERLTVYRDLRAAVRAVQPDYVLIPSGDAPATAMSVWRWLGLGNLPVAAPCEVGIHFGAGRAVHGLRQMRDRLNLLNLALSGVRRVHLVNLLFYELARRSFSPNRFSLMPHPVAAQPRLTRSEARRRLGIPEDGRYVGIAGSLDSRKALPEFLAAFRAACHRPDERLLLAGWLHRAHDQHIKSTHGDLLKEGRLLLMNSFLSPDSYHAAISALDVVATPYPNFLGLSSTLLEAVSAGRPVLANASGWMQEIVSRFRVGSTCDVLDHGSFTRTLRHALDTCDEYQETAAIGRLLTFHSPQNFAACWVQGLSERHGTRAPCFYDWNWVEEGL